MNFVAIDFETTTSNPASICSMGICEVVRNKVKKTEEFLIKPNPFEFNEYNTKIHGITPEMVFTKPTFDQYWPKIKPYIENNLVIAHNASFDITALKRAMTLYNIEYPNFDYLCTVQLSRKAYPDLPGHKLNELAEVFNVEFSHHNAGDDAYACAMVMLNIIKDFSVKRIGDFKKHFDITPSKVFPGCDNTPTKKERKKVCE